MLNLTLTEKGGSTNELSFDKGEVSVGRVRGNDIVLPKGNVSKHHCKFVIRGGEVIVEDMHSTNGTYVNGRKIGEPTSLSPGDKVFVGDFIMRMAAADPLRTSAPPAHPEAGSLSSAIPRRAPPPPPAHRSTMADEGMGSGPKVPPPISGRHPFPPPPPPPLPGKRESKVVPAISDALPSPPSGPSDINLDDDDDDGIGTPHFKVPPLKPAVQPAERMSDMETPDGLSSGPTTPPPSPQHEHQAADSSGDDMAPPEPSAASSSELPSEPPSSDDDIFSSPPSKSGHKPHGHSPEAAKHHETSKPKAHPAPSPAAKSAARQLDRDIPEWLAHLLDGEGVTAAFFTGANQVEVQRHGRRESASVPASDLAGLGAVIRKVVVRGAPKPAADAATINTTLPDGMHIAAIFPPVADRLCVAIRRPVAVGKTIEDLVDEKVISAEMRQVLDACVIGRQNMLVCGDRAACDSLLRAILWSVDRVARVVLLSGSITPPASATSWLKLQPESQPGDLVAAAVAMLPEYLVVDAGHASLSGEVLGECNLGMSGVIVSVVARSTNEALHRLQSLTTAHGGPMAAGADWVASSIDVIVHASVMPDGSLRVIEVAEPKASLDGQLSANALLTWIPGEDGKGSFSVTGAHSTLATKLSQTGNEIPSDILSRQ